MKEPNVLPQDTDHVTEPTAPETIDLNDAALYLNRELTWLAFNRRVLYEAEDSRNPLLERLKFLAIVSSNLDEFFMKRIGGLKQQVGAGMTVKTVDGRTPREQITECYSVVRDQEQAQRAIFHQLRGELAAHEIEIVGYESLGRDDIDFLRAHFHDYIFPLITPQSIDPAHPFPFISNLSLNLLVHVRFPGQEGRSSLARVKVPTGENLPRFIGLPGRNHFVPVEEVLRNNLDMLMPEMEVISVYIFRVTRNANTERNEEHADDLLSMIESELRDRRFAPIVRLQIQGDMDETSRGMLAAELGLDENEDVFNAGGDMLAMRDLFQLVGIDSPELHDEPFQAVDHPDLSRGTNIFHLIRDRGPFLLQHPYESFGTSVERFLKEAALDPKVRAIKMTLYRTSSDTQVIDNLVRAARHGKQVAVVVELKARFDEAANIRWAARMEEAGIHVTYGVVGLKTHSKIVLVVRNDYNGIRRYLHIGTGNYHAGTARLYSDLGILTNDQDLGRDATELFNYLTTGYTPERYYRKLLPAPKVLKVALLARIQRERSLHSADKPGLIQFKMNALEDVDITRALYEASREGVRVDLIARDTCRFRPGVPGLSESARVISIVGRFLEHTRIYYFQNGGDEEYFIGSADCMKRNLESRVEVVTPVEGESLRQELRETLDSQLADYRNGWEMQSDGGYVKRVPRDEAEEIGSQQRAIERAKARAKQTIRYQRGKTRWPVAGRNLR
ncbi:MAG: polyphosphate kinase 1 [Sedimenticolaceae bacterium]